MRAQELEERLSNNVTSQATRLKIQTESVIMKKLKTHLVSWFTLTHS
jgi:hypothetical protein